ncbi:zinc-finger double-stranded RNA-binding domain-containing protein [Sarocladium implicatum]|nr:zinc-finger double-stranded RNA-binding domain-containing protein [Sarocladium implicatum]
MPPRHQTLPAAQTSSAREAQKSFYCDLCSKGYSRMNDYEAHLSSYDHSHKQRLKDMKAMVRDPTSVARARKAEAKADGLISIKIPGQESQQQQQQQGATGGFKKGGFKKSGFKSAFAPVEGQAQPVAATKPTNEGMSTKPSLSKSLVPNESDTEDEGYEVYDPRYPTD